MAWYEIFASYLLLVCLIHASCKGGVFADDNCGVAEITPGTSFEETFHAPGYPEGIGSYLTCWYNVRSPNGTRIRFWFDSFGITTYGNNFYVWCYNDENLSDKFLILNQKSQEGSMFHSASNFMRIRVEIYRSYNYTGFRFRTIALDTCESRLEAYDDAQPLLSPGYPFKHLSNQICLWTIVAAPDHVIILTTNQISNDTCCTSFKVDGNLVSVTQSSVFQSSGNEMKIEFISNNSIARNPFLFYYKSEHVCGQKKLVATDLFRSFQAPPYPDVASSYFYCEYTVVAPKNLRIRFKINNFGTETFRENYFYLWFHDGSCENDERFLNLDKEYQTNQTFHSKSRMMFIKLRAYKSYKYTGFHMSYQAVPSHTYHLIATENPQNIFSRGYPGPHLSNEVSTWVIIVPTGYTIELNLIYISRETCCVRVEVYDRFAQTTRNQLNTTSVYYSSNYEVEVTFVAQQSLERSGFELTYTKTPCGNDLIATTLKQTLSSPGFPLPHRPSQKCLWSITSNTNYVIKIEVKYLSNEACCSRLKVIFPTNSVEINNTTRTLTSPGTTGQVEFIANNSVERKGFNLHYTAVHICGDRQFKAEIDHERLITPPPYPESYSSSMYCWYTITAPENTRIRFWVDDFGGEIPNSNYFYMNFYNRLEEIGSIFLTINQLNQLGAMYDSSSNLLGIRVKVYKSFVYTGFTMRYTAVESCGLNFIAPINSSNISIPAYPHQYRSNLSCTWIMTSPTDHVVEIRTGFVSNQTSYEQLQIEGVTPLLLHSDQEYTSPGSSVSVGYFSNHSLERSGFELEYKAVHICGDRQFKAEIDHEQVITPPPYPESYGSYMYCWYTITAPDNTRIRFWVDDYGSERLHPNYFYMQFYNRLEEIGSSFLIMDELNQLGVMYDSSSNLLGIKLKADKSYVYTGFTMRYMAVESCGLNIIAPINSSNISIPAYPHQYQSNLSCTWIITSPTDHLVEIRTGFVSNQTSYEQLEIEGVTSLLLHSDQEYTSPGSSVSVGYFSNHSLERSGFELEYKAVHICGDRQFKAEIDHEQVITPPPYPESYGSYMYCWYTITAPDNTRIRFWVDDYGSETLYSNRFYMKFYNRLEEIESSFLIMDELNQLGIMYNSSSNLLGIKLQAYKSYVYTGFTMRYMAVETCGMDLTAISTFQSLSTPDYPLNYKSNLTCRWTISTNSYQVIRLQSVDVSNDSCCEQLKLISPTSLNFTSNQIYTSPGTSLTIEFYSHNSSQRRGFYLMYKSENICGEKNFTAELNSKKFITPPPMPEDFFSNFMECWYTIVSPEKSRIKFVVNDFGTEHYYHYYFYLKFYNGLGEVSDNFLTLDAPSQAGVPFYSKSHVMSFKLNAYKPYTYTGFNMTYEAIESCEGVFEAMDHAQSFHSCGNASNGFYNWTIRAPCNHVVYITPTNISLDSNTEKLFVVDSSSDNILIESNTNYISPGRMVEVDFIKNGSEKQSEMNIMYKAVHICGTTDFDAKLDDLQEVHQPPQPRDYEDYMSCLYTVRSPPGTKIQFRFTSFGVNTYHQSYFFMKFYDGFSEEEENKFITLGGANDINTTHISRDNMMTFRMEVNRRYIIYSGFTMQYSSIAADDELDCNVRVDFSLTYRLSVNSTIKTKYLLSSDYVLDMSENVFLELQKETNFTAELIDTSLPPILNKTKVQVRVEQTWIFNVTIRSDLIYYYRFLFGQLNDVNLAVFSQVFDDVESAQMNQVDFTEKEIETGYEIYSVRVDFLRTYKVLMRPESVEDYGLSLIYTNDMTQEVFETLLLHEVYAQLTRVDKEAPFLTNRFMVRVDQTRLYNLSLSSTQQNNFKLSQESLNDLSLSVFIQIRRNAELVQLIGWQTVKTSETLYEIRDDYTRTYKAEISLSLVEYYAFDSDTINDVASFIFNDVRDQATYLQLVTYYPTTPIPPLVKVRVDFERTYEVSASKTVRDEYSFTSDHVNDVSSHMFSVLKHEVYFAQLFNVSLSSQGSGDGTQTRIRVDFYAVYLVILSDDAIQKYYLDSNLTNDVSPNIFDSLVYEYSLSPELVETENVPPHGSSFDIGINQTREYKIYLPEEEATKYQFTEESTNNMSENVFVTIKKEANALQLTSLILRFQPTGTKITIRVDFTRVYICYVSDETKLKYQLFLKKMNNVSSSVFDTIRKEAEYVEMIEIQTPGELSTPIRVRVEYTFVYDLYFSEDTKPNFNLSSDVMQDISQSIFVLLQHQSTITVLIAIHDKNDVITRNKFRVRVNLYRIYEVYLSDDNVHSFPLVVGKVNDITTSIFEELSHKAVVNQLVSIRNNPVTATIRVAMKWVYRLIIPDSVRIKYNLELSKTNDVSNSIFTSLREQTSSFELVNEQYQVVSNLTLVRVQVAYLWNYNFYLEASLVSKYNLTVNQTNEISVELFEEISTEAQVVELTHVNLAVSQSLCPSNNWTEWFNRDDPSGPCDCETLPELRHDYPGQICEKPTTIQARLENCLIPYDPTLSNIVANVEIGFRCDNEPGTSCLDYEVRFCCP